MIRPPAACPTLELFDVGDHINVQVSGLPAAEAAFVAAYKRYDAIYDMGVALAMDLAADELGLKIEFSKGR